MNLTVSEIFENFCFLLKFSILNTFEALGHIGIKNVSLFTFAIILNTFAITSCTFCGRITFPTKVET